MFILCLDKEGIGLWLEGKVPQRPGDRLMTECIPQGCQACLLPGDRGACNQMSGGPVLPGIQRLGFVLC